jgi:hypothetical protein
LEKGVESSLILLRDKIHSFNDAKVWELPPPRDVLLNSVADLEGLLSLLIDEIDSELMVYT